MGRPTSLIRHLLIMESFQEFVTQEIARTKAEMRSQGLTVIDRKENPQDIWIQYRYGPHSDEAIYMRRMLEAETQSRAKRAGIRL